MSEHRDTETLDRLYLEWSQFTKARTQRETHLIHSLKLFLNAETAEQIATAKAGARLVLLSCGEHRQ